ncbi:MAG: cyclic nucleotide-binding domain-containing protein [Myxococcales bacterium]|nr:cyclic nucleotide-binding domain-containing protein [Myxococcales bacterium]MCB9523650.1 cyclic nucleotide-binding domain-containing protein [Myxococcales bacterium]
MDRRVRRPASVLEQIPLFDGLTRREIEVLKAHMRRVKLGPGVRLFTEGERGASCFVIIQGTIEVHKELGLTGVERLATLKAGALVGHLALIDHKPRSATCRAGEEGALLLELGRAEFDRLFQAKSPFTYKLLDRITMDLVARLRAATQQLVATHDEAPERRRRAARAAAEELSGYRGAMDLGDIDLDQITVEVPDEVARLRRTPPPIKG